jgi:hypothetical protein
MGPGIHTISLILLNLGQCAVSRSVLTGLSLRRYAIGRSNCRAEISQSSARVENSKANVQLVSKPHRRGAGSLIAKFLPRYFNR